MIAKKYYLNILCRFFIGINLLYSGISKLINISKFTIILNSYNMVNESIINELSLIITLFEILLGLMLVLNLYIKLATYLSVFTFLSMTLLMLYNIGNTLPFGCGCLENNFKSQKISYLHVLYDSFLGVVVLGCFIKKK